MKTGMTQAQRSAATRRRLLDAAAKVLISQGYASLTTTRVCKLAGLSQGALFKHFASKMDLLAALAEDLYAGLARDFETLFKALEPGRDIIHESIRHLWAIFSSARQLATYDLTIAARTDAVLKEHLDMIVLRHRDRIGKIADKISRQVDMAPDQFNAWSDMVLMVVQGMVINGLAFSEKENVEKRLTFIEDLAKERVRVSGREAI